MKLLERKSSQMIVFRTMLHGWHFDPLKVDIIWEKKKILWQNVVLHIWTCGEPRASKDSWSQNRLWAFDFLTLCAHFDGSNVSTSYTFCNLSCNYGICGAACVCKRQSKPIISWLSAHILMDLMLANLTHSGQTGATSPDTNPHYPINYNRIKSDTEELTSGGCWTHSRSLFIRELPKW